MKLWYGWNEALDIPSALDRGLHEGLDGTIAMLSMIDSTPDVAGMQSLIPKLERGRRFYTVVDRDVAVDMSTLVLLIEDDFFLGFEEVWFYRTVPSRGKPSSVRLTSDQRLIEPNAGLQG